MIRIAIVEDEPQVQSQLVEYVHRFERQYSTRFEVCTFNDGDEIVEDYHPVYDIIFLDIEMRRMDGMAAAERIRTMDKDVLLIFITNMAQFAIRGYAVDAMDFVLKPVPYFAFSQQLQKAAGRVKKRAKTFLNVMAEGGMLRLDVSEIYYLESEGHKLHAWAENGDWLLAGTIRELEERLAPCGFARCNSGYLVNLAQVTQLRQNEVQVGPHSLQVSRPRKKFFMEALTDYVGGVAK